MTQEQERTLSLSDKVMNRKQQLFVRYIVAILIDLTVLNIFNEFFPEYLIFESFILSLFVAVVLQLLLQGTLKFEHAFAEYFFKDKTDLTSKILRGLSAWAIIFVSKLVMLKVLSLLFGSAIVFAGALHGVVAFILVIMSMIIAEQIVLKIYQSLADKPATEK